MMHRFGTRIAPPWYVHPADDPAAWRWLSERTRAVSFAVVNIHNGPGSPDDPHYGPVLASPLPRLLGYVDLDYGHRRLRVVRQEVAAWVQGYQLSGIMFDRVPASPDSVTRCATFARAAREGGASFLAGNPGTFPTLAHLALYDVTAVFEDTAEAYRTFRHPAWARPVPRHRMWHLVHTADPAQVRAARSEAGRRGAGHVFVTDRTLPHPWAGPPVTRGPSLVRRRWTP